MPNRYAMNLHGSGMVDEYPNAAHLVDWEENGWDGVFEENMVLSVESYIGEVGGKEGVKLEQQVVLTATGAELMSKEPFGRRPGDLGSAWITRNLFDPGLHLTQVRLGCGDYAVDAGQFGTIGSGASATSAAITDARSIRPLAKTISSASWSITSALRLTGSESSGIR